MCIRKYRIHHNYDPVAKVGDGGRTCVFAPCGYCEDCRKKAQYSWAWRLTADLQYFVQVRGYKVGFITLTYNEEMLPRIPSCYETIAGMPCFSRTDTEKFILYLRKKLCEKYNAVDSLYFLSSERGKENDRPHYHFLVAWDGSKASPEQVHELIRHYWADDLVCALDNRVTRPALGFVCPSTPQGGESKASGEKILPFEVKDLDSCLKSAFYTAKYVTKDLYFMRDVLNKVTMFELRELKEYMPHHRQRKSLGFTSVAAMSDKEKISLLNKGKFFFGSDRLMMPPMYIQNKLLFEPCYIVDSNGDRLVKQRATDFLAKYHDLIFSKKVSYYDTLFKSMEDENYWVSSGVDSEKAKDASYFVRNNNFRSLFGCKLSEAYIYYFGVPFNFCYTDKKLTLLNRYRFFHKYPYVYTGATIAFEHWKNIQEFFGYLMSFLSFKQESIRDETADFVREFYNKVELRQ